MVTVSRVAVKAGEIKIRSDKRNNRRWKDFFMAIFPIYYSLSEFNLDTDLFFNEAEI
jgi:hypothetical protein